MKYNISGKTDVGVARNNNEDSLISFSCPLGQVVAVCDGMGGENGGETASNLAVSIIQDILENQTFTSPEEGIVSACMAANQGILYRASQYPELAGMGSTCVIAIIKGDKIYYGSVGDSRIYYYLPGKGFSQLTKDQSFVQTLVDSGQITKEEAEHHPQKNEITNALGYEGMQPPVVDSIAVIPGARLLLCSDGLSGMVPDASLLHVIKREDWTIEEKVDKFISLANEAGGLDNITVQLVEWSGGVNKTVSPASRPSLEKTNKTANIVIAIACIVLLGCAAFVGWKMLHKNPAPAKPTPVHKSTPTVVEPKKSDTNFTSKPSTTTTTEKKITVEKNTVVDKKTIIVNESEKGKDAKKAIKDVSKKNIPTVKDAIKKEDKKSTVVPPGIPNPPVVPVPEPDIIKPGDKDYL